jgi:predicted CxxxxCH...CXXCH cytochrome family protein
MSQVNKIKVLLVLIGSFIVAAAGCSSANKEAAFNPNTGQHPADWFTAHRAAYAANPSSCTQCHGTDLQGGVAAANCFSATFNGMTCHGTSWHLPNWASPDSHGAAAKAMPDVTVVQGFSTCQICHGANFDSGIFAGFQTITCLNSCHVGVNGPVNAPHSPAPWRASAGSLRTHTNTNTGNAPVCGLCHTNGANSSVKPSPPAQAGTPPDCFNNTLCHGVPTGACGTCHTLPPSGTVFPNIAGNHAVHTALPNVGVCTVCHNGAEFGTAHPNGVVEVSILSTYNAESGAALYSAASNTCSNVSCHGASRTQTSAQAGQTPPASTATQTPVWLNGTIIVNTDCSVCHVLGSAPSTPGGFPTPEYNSYYSGQHYRHVYGSASGAFTQPACTVCHDITNLAVNHFTTLNTPAMEGPASATIAAALNYNTSVTPHTCTPACHGTIGTQSWQ